MITKTCGEDNLLVPSELSLKLFIICDSNTSFLFHFGRGAVLVEVDALELVEAGPSAKNVSQ